MKLLVRAVLALVLLFGAFESAPADNEIPPWKDAQALRDYADEWMRRGDHERAVIEYKRFLALYPGHPGAMEVELRLGLAYRGAGDERRAIEVFYSLAALSEEENGISARALFYLAETYARAGMHAEALREYRAFLQRYPDDPLISEARYGAGWALMALGDGKGASLQFSAVGRSSLLFPMASQLERSAPQIDDIRRPSPVVAGVLSGILPGAGHAYAGRPQNAIVSFLINGALIAGAVACFARGNEGAGLLLTIFESGWYVGGIRSAARDAREVYREALEERLMGMAKTHDFPLQLKSQEPEVSVEFFRIPLGDIIR